MAYAFVEPEYIEGGGENMHIFEVEKMKQEISGVFPHVVKKQMFYLSLSI